MAAWDWAEMLNYLEYLMEKTADNIVLQRWLLHYEDKMSLDDFRNNLKAAARPAVEAPITVIEADVKQILSMGWR